MRPVFNKIIVTLSALLFLSLFVSCDPLNKKKKTEDQFDITGKKYVVVPETTSVFWTAYKTSEKIPVKGQFMKLEIKNPTLANSAKEAIDGIAFSIPISSLFSNEEERDSKLKEFFFGVMDQTEFLNGDLHIENDTLAMASVQMNGITNQVPLTYFLDGQMISMQGKMNLNDWKGQTALASLNKVCEDLHKGPDGKSVTWDEVGINIESYLKVE